MDNKWRFIGLGLASLGISIPVIAALLVTKDVNALWGLVIIPIVWFFGLVF